MVLSLQWCGKSTLIRCINLLENPQRAGEIEGKDITKLSNRELMKLRRSLGMIFQHFNLLMQKTK